MKTQRTYQRRQSFVTEVAGTGTICVLRTSCHPYIVVSEVRTCV